MMVACRCLVLPTALLIACRSCGAGAGAGGRSTRPGFSISPFRPCRKPFVTAASRSFLAACGSLRIGRRRANQGTQVRAGACFLHGMVILEVVRPGALAYEQPSLDTLGLECFRGIGEGVNPQ
jgi:hypothetical protein